MKLCLRCGLRRVRLDVGPHQHADVGTNSSCCPYNGTNAHCCLYNATEVRHKSKFDVLFQDNDLNMVGCRVPGRDPRPASMYQNRALEVWIPSRRACGAL